MPQNTCKRWPRYNALNMFKHVSKQKMTFLRIRKMLNVTSVFMRKQTYRHLSKKVCHLTKAEKWHTHTHTPQPPPPISVLWISLLSQTQFRRWLYLKLTHTHSMWMLCSVCVQHTLHNIQHHVNLCLPVDTKQHDMPLDIKKIVTSQSSECAYPWRICEMWKWLLFQGVTLKLEMRTDFFQMCPRTPTCNDMHQFVTGWAYRGNNRCHNRAAEAL